MRPKILNLYAGIGGNRYLWKDCDVTAVEKDVQAARIYSRLFPDDHVCITDAKEYLLRNIMKYDFIWASPPCQSHSKLNTTGNLPLAYPDLSLYQMIIYLQQNAKCPWIVENVDPYYDPLIATPYKIDRHIFWSDYYLPPFDVPREKGIVSMSGGDIAKWLQMDFKGLKPTRQMLRNCVHPVIGKILFDVRPKEQEELCLAK